MDLYHEGYLPEAIVNYLALLGWSPNSNQEIFTLDELIKEFDPKRISKSPSIYDEKKLQWVNAHYIKKLDDERLFEITIPHLKEAYDLSQHDDAWVKELVLLYKDHISYGKEIVSVTEMFFHDKLKLNDECIDFMKDESIPNTLKVFQEEIQNMNDWTVENIKEAINHTKEKAGVKGKMLFMPIRIQITGVMHGPELPNTIHLLGKDTVLKRLGE